MLAKRLVIVGVSVAAALGGAALVFDQLAGAPAASLSAPSSTGTAAPDGAGASPAPGSQDAGIPVAPGTATDSGTGQSPGAGEGTESPAPAAGLQEVLPPVAAAPTGLPVPSTPAALVSIPLPPTASAQGKIVAGFPEESLRFPDGSVVVSTGVSAADTVLQVTADAISAASQDAVVGHFQQQLAKLNFWSEPAPATEGQRAVRFVRGADSVTLTTSATGTGSTRFMLLGNLHATAG